MYFKRKEIGSKAPPKMLAKLTTGLQRIIFLLNVRVKAISHRVSLYNDQLENNGSLSKLVPLPLVGWLSEYNRATKYEMEREKENEMKKTKRDPYFFPRSKKVTFFFFPLCYHYDLKRKVEQTTSFFASRRRCSSMNKIVILCVTGIAPFIKTIHS